MESLEKLHKKIHKLLEGGQWDINLRDTMFSTNDWDYLKRVDRLVRSVAESPMVASPAVDEDENRMGNLSQQLKGATDLGGGDRRI